MTLSQNGWTGIAHSADPRLADFPWVTGKVRSGDVWTVLNHVAERFNTEVEPIVKAKSWGWAYRLIRGAKALSNHASGTAVDFNAPDHWLGEVGTFTPVQVRAIHSILADCGGVVRWGGDYSGRKDEMHFEINLGAAGSAAKVAAAAAKIKGQAASLGSAKPLVPTLARVATFNCGAWGKKAMTAKQIDGIVGVLLTLNASIYCLTECPEWLRDHLRGVCECSADAHRRMPGGPSRWLVRVRGSQAILRDSRKWVGGKFDSAAFGPTDYHGWLYEKEKNPITGATLVVGCYHLPPNAVATQNYQRDRLKTFLAKLTTGPRLVGGDGADDAGWAVGWADARYAAKASENRDAPTYKGKAITDRIHSRGIVVRRYTVIPSAGASDHDAVLGQITMPAGSDPTL